MTGPSVPTADRYGSARSRYGRGGAGDQQRRTLLSRKAVIIAGVVAVVAIAAIAWLAFKPNSAPVKPDTVRYQVVDAGLTEVEITVVPDATRSITCSVQATNKYDAVVGFVEVTIPAQANASAARPVQQRVEVRTTQVADSGHLRNCWFN